MEVLHDLGPIHVEPLKSMIAIKKNSQFCSIQVQQKALKISFRLFSQLSSPRFTASSEQDDRRHYYQLKIEELDDIDEQFVSWMELAYEEN